MKKLITLFLISLFLLSGCVSPPPEIRYYKSYNKPPDADEFISGNGFKIWVSKDSKEYFVPIKKESQEWQSVQESLGVVSLQLFLYNRDSGIFFIIAKNRYKQSYNKVLHNFKQLGVDATILESDQRMVNNSPALYIRMFKKEGDLNMIVSTYWINTNLGTFLFSIGCVEDDYGKYKKMIQDILNGVEVN